MQALSDLDRLEGIACCKDDVTVVAQRLLDQLQDGPALLDNNDRRMVASVHPVDDSSGRTGSA
jgi:hypothetical protein